MNAGVRLRFGGFLISLAGRKGFTNDAPDWGVFALVTYQMNVGSPFVAKAAAGPGAGGAGAGTGTGAGGAPGAGGPGTGGAPGAGGPGAGGPGAGGPGAGGAPGAGGPGAGGAPGAGGPGAGAPRCRWRAREPVRPGAGGPGGGGTGPGGGVAALPAAALPPRTSLGNPRHQLPVRPGHPDGRGEGDPRRAGPGAQGEPAFIVTLEGHADERGTVEYNLALGEQRAQAAKAYLVALGMDASRIDTVSFGEQQPRRCRHDELAWAINRRVHFLVRGR